MLTDETWRDALSARLAEVSWPQALSDVEPFLESGADISLLTPENLHSLLARARLYTQAGAKLNSCRM